MSKVDRVQKKRTSSERNRKLHEDAVCVQTVFPTFRQPYLQSFRLCACFPLDQTELSTRISQLSGKKGSTWETKFESTKGPARIKVRIGLRRDLETVADKTEGYLQFHCVLESSINPQTLIANPPNSTEEEVGALLKLFAQHKAEVTCSEGIFCIPRETMPKKGFISLMLDISANIGNAEMNLTGASFDIQKCAPYEQLRWKQRVISGDGDTERHEIEVAIMGSPETPGIFGLPEQVANILSDGIQKLVIEIGG